MPRPIPERLERRFLDYLAEHPSGGSLHIVLDDQNIEDQHVEFCIDWARSHDDAEGEQLAWILLGMSQRRRLTMSTLDNVDAAVTVRELNAEGQRQSRGSQRGTK